MPWLTDMDVACHLVECKLLDCVPADSSWLQGLADLVKARWQNETGWSPYLVAEPTTITLRPRTRMVDLPSVLVSSESITLNGITLTEGEHYELVGRGECLKLWTGPSRGSELVIAGAVLGRETDLPADVKEALLALCAAKYAERQAGSTGIVHDVRQGDVSFRSKQTQSEAFKGIWSETVKRHRRVVIR